MHWVTTGCCYSIADDGPSVAPLSAVSQGDTLVYAHTLGKMAVRRNKHVSVVVFYHIENVFLFVHSCSPGRVQQDKMVLQDPLEIR